jgi:hypothetical protein
LFPKYAKSHLQASEILKIFLGLYPRIPVNGRVIDLRGRKERDRWGGDGDIRERRKE